MTAASNSNQENQMYTVSVNGKNERFASLREAQDNAQIRSWMENSPATIRSPDGTRVNVDLNQGRKDVIR
jgi:long-subunit fatty acid transport protein